MEKHAGQKSSVIYTAQRFVWAWGPVVVWMAIIFSFSNRQRITVSPEYILNFLFFKSLHILEYAALYILNVRALRMSQKKPSSAVFSRALIIVLLYAASDELHQTFVPTREGAVRDVIIDGIGASIVWYFLSKQLPKAHKKLKSLAKALDLIS